MDTVKMILLFLIVFSFAGAVYFGIRLFFPEEVK